MADRNPSKVEAGGLGKGGKGEGSGGEGETEGKGGERVEPPTFMTKFMPLIVDSLWV